ncbi:MAG: hypothetical protein Q4P24_17020 [Rhodobacterales bacterium]|nr:hypothetical protein [Rhodobacterales bacterium]
MTVTRHLPIRDPRSMDIRALAAAELPLTAALLTEGMSGQS